VGRRGEWIQTYSGTKFYPLDPRPEDVSIVDIAHALSNVCRYSGHCAHFYSVAQHSVLVSANVPPEDALAGLLHDASEAYIADVCRPLKRERAFAEYRHIEFRLQATIFKAFGIERMTLPESVTLVDNLMLATEARDLMSPSQRSSELIGEWKNLGAPIPRLRIRPWPSAVAKEVFLERYAAILAENVANNLSMERRIEA